jgi:hypothetical protein
MLRSECSAEWAGAPHPSQGPGGAAGRGGHLGGPPTAASENRDRGGEQDRADEGDIEQDRDGDTDSERADVEEAGGGEWDQRGDHDQARAGRGGCGLSQPNLDGVLAGRCRAIQVPGAAEQRVGAAKEQLQNAEGRCGDEQAEQRRDRR